jgi:hypothetical protein
MLVLLLFLVTQNNISDYTSLDFTLHHTLIIGNFHNTVSEGLKIKR